MSVFIQKLNPITGINDWVVQNEDYDYHQEVARASFADMLHDKERNQLYEKALKIAIDTMHQKGKKANVLDIGTGTGLLSMMAVRNGADSVVACEAFKPMSECARKIIKRNHYEDAIKIIPKRSTDLTVGDGVDSDLTEPCNILVTEVFDTELIGEGALSTFSHAHKYLLEKDCIVVPNSATIYAQVIECPLVQDWNKLKDVYNDEGELLIRVPDSVKACAGSASVHDIQLSQIAINNFTTIMSPLPVFRFDWSGKTPFVYDRFTINSRKAERTGKAQAVFMWWDLEMDFENKLILSCAPYWAHPKGSHNMLIPWRDHWMQAIYYLPEELSVKEGDEINLISCHDEYSLWFNLKPNLKLSDADYLKPVCECGLHVAFSRTRIGQMNDSTRNKKYLSLFEKYVNKDSTIVVLSDGYYLSLAAATAKMHAKKMYYVETNYLSRKILLDFVKSNNLVDRIEIFENIKELEDRNDIKDVNLVIGEPYFTSSILPWDNLLFIYLVKGVKKILSSNVQIFPKTAIIKGIAIKFSDLHKIRSPLKTCEGFMMNEFDELIEISSNISDDNVEAQPLWEYPGIALSKVVEIATISVINTFDKTLESTGTFDVKTGFGGCNGIALWIEWLYEEVPKRVVSSGPISAPEIGCNINWDSHTRQGVCLFPNKDVAYINYTFKFDFNEGNISFKCN